MNSSTRTAFATVARELADAFEHATRNDGTEFYKFADNAPAWIADADVSHEMHAAIDDRLPDDWVYATAHSIAEQLADYSDDLTAESARDAMGEIADGLVDVYNNARAAWLADHINNGALCDEAAEEYGPVDGIYEQIGRGQYMAIERIGYALIEAIDDEASTRDDA